MIKKLGIALLLLALGGGTIMVDPVTSLSGRYSKSFPNALSDGEQYLSENIVEIVPVSANAAYVRVHTEWTNGHSCSLWGIATAAGDQLVYHDLKSRDLPSYGRCVLSIRREGNQLRLNDEDNSGCYARYCGMRGSFSNIKLPFYSRRPITYLTRLRASPQFKEAMANWQSEH
ncbi:hypothetical protein [Novosphingobium naphthalenivorans]|uniref:hypothetical protein n=1 Tax=Novosphingobium naphthalenivorans TaxID=273168 RepID=UPI0012EEC1C1|nr:hypothetical protein [Novosphingobium naphthalenivorans]